MQIGLERDDAKSKLKTATLKNNALVLDIHAFKMNEMKVLKPKIEQMTMDLELQFAKVRVLEKSEIALDAFGSKLFKFSSPSLRHNTWLQRHEDV